jgi:outer membrane receptor protein involved in Fe transport
VTPPPAQLTQDAVQLSPFVISTERETGWSATDTLSATRTKQALKDVPVNIDAITSDFIEDLGLNTADEVTQFVANVYAAPTMENDNQTDNFSFRGLSQRFNVSRNYFRWYVPSDTYNVERIDFGKGSNSLIFGDVEPGGQGSVFTKRALMKNFGTLVAQYGSEGAYRYQLDLNRKLRDGLALRFNAIRRQEKDLPGRFGLQAGGRNPGPHVGAV